MTKIEVGDHVQLTGSIMLGLASQAPDVFEALRQNNRVGGEVLEIDGNKVMIDMGDTLRGPLAIEVDGENPALALQLMKKAGSSDLAEPYEADPEPQQQPQRSGAPQGIFPPFPFGSQNPVPLDYVPQNVRLSQWVMTQFLQLKQYGIAQDLTRVDDEQARLPEPGSEAEQWKNEGKNLRAVMIELSATEEQLYNAALGQIKGWITGAEGVPHPELVPSPEDLDPAHVVADEADDLEPHTSAEPEEGHEASTEAEG